MFPVSLEFNDGEVATIFPPCYGFLKQGQWDGGNDEDYPTKYEAFSGWNAIIEGKEFSYSIYNEGYSVEEVILSDEYCLDQAKYIWNSGTHYPIIGASVSDGEHLCQQFHSDRSNLPVVFGRDATRPKSNVELWSEANNMPDVTVERVMNIFDGWLDKDLDCCFVWSDEGCFGVEASAEADRCLFYLMLNRSLYSSTDCDNIFKMLDLIFKDNKNPMLALLVSRIIVDGTTKLVGGVEPHWTGNDYDSCIFPISLITVGIANQFEEPIQVKWRQGPYTDGHGHLRDEDYPSISYSDTNVNNSMFLPILHPNLCDESLGTLEIKEEALLVAFCKEIAQNNDAFNRLSKYPSHDRINFYWIIQQLSGNRFPENLSVVPKEEWSEIVIKLLTSK